MSIWYNFIQPLKKSSSQRYWITWKKSMKNAAILYEQIGIDPWMKKASCWRVWVSYATYHLGEKQKGPYMCVHVCMCVFTFLFKHWVFLEGLHCKILTQGGELDGWQKSERGRFFAVYPLFLVEFWTMILPIQNVNTIKLWPQPHSVPSFGNIPIVTVYMCVHRKNTGGINPTNCVSFRASPLKIDMYHLWNQKRN